jgi:hypothetical protein
MVYDLTSSKTENIFYYLKKEEGGVTSINSFSPVAGKVTKLSEIKVLDIIVSGENKDSLFMSSKPTSKAKQLSIILNKKNNTLEYISSSDNNKYTLGGGVIKELAGAVSFSDTENYKRNSSLSIKSFADKCSDVYSKYLVCGEDETFSDEFRILDYWHSGKVSFTDSLSFLNLFNGEKTTIPASLISGEPLDIYSINVGEGFLTFKNKNDESLWLVDLAGL